MVQLQRAYPEWSDTLGDFCLSFNAGVFSSRAPDPKNWQICLFAPRHRHLLEHWSRLPGGLYDPKAFACRKYSFGELLRLLKRRPNDARVFLAAYIRAAPDELSLLFDLETHKKLPPNWRPPEPTIDPDSRAAIAEMSTNPLLAALLCRCEDLHDLLVRAEEDESERGRHAAYALRRIIDAFLDVIVTVAQTPGVDDARKLASIGAIPETKPLSGNPNTADTLPDLDDLLPRIVNPFRQSPIKLLTTRSMNLDSRTKETKRVSERAMFCRIEQSRKQLIDAYAAGDTEQMELCVQELFSTMRTHGVEIERAERPEFSRLRPDEIKKERPKNVHRDSVLRKNCLASFLARYIDRVGIGNKGERLAQMAHVDPQNTQVLLTQVLRTGFLQNFVEEFSDLRMRSHGLLHRAFIRDANFERLFEFTGMDNAYVHCFLQRFVLSQFNPPADAAMVRAYPESWPDLRRECEERSVLASNLVPRRGRRHAMINQVHNNLPSAVIVTKMVKMEKPKSGAMVAMAAACRRKLQYSGSRQRRSKNSTARSNKYPVGIARLACLDTIRKGDVQDVTGLSDIECAAVVEVFAMGLGGVFRVNEINRLVRRLPKASKIVCNQLIVALHNRFLMHTEPLHPILRYRGRRTPTLTYHRANAMQGILSGYGLEENSKGPLSAVPEFAKEVSFKVYVCPKCGMLGNTPVGMRLLNRANVESTTFAAKRGTKSIANFQNEVSGKVDLDEGLRALRVRRTQGKQTVVHQRMLNGIYSDTNSCLSCNGAHVLPVAADEHLILGRGRTSDIAANNETRCRGCGDLTSLYDRNTVGLFPVCVNCARKTSAAMVRMRPNCYMNHEMKLPVMRDGVLFAARTDRPLSAPGVSRMPLDAEMGIEDGTPAVRMFSSCLKHCLGAYLPMSMSIEERAEFVASQPRYTKEAMGKVQKKRRRVKRE